MTDQTLPDKLIKYYKCDEYSCDALLNNYLWASHPTSFNDPFDCPFDVWNPNSFTKENLKKILNPEFYKDLGHLFENNTRDQYLKFIHLFTGIICLNEYYEENEDLLWGYYTNQAGFTVEFDEKLLSKSLKLSPELVNYKNPDEFETYSIPDNIENIFGMIPFFKKWIRQKKRIWNNETEWRYIFFDCNYNACPEYGIKESRRKRYSLDSISKIVLGFRFFEACYLEKMENGYIYDYSRLLNPSKIEIIKYLLNNQQIPIYWINIQDGLQFGQIQIKLREFNQNKVHINYTFQ